MVARGDGVLAEGSIIVKEGFSGDTRKIVAAIEKREYLH